MKKKYFSCLCLLFLSFCCFSQQWTTKMGLQSNTRHHPVSWAINGIGYSVTGASPSEQSGSKDFFSYQPSTNSWTQLNDFSGAARSYSIGGVYQGEGYLGFGAGPNNQYYNDLWKYNVQTDTWTQLASCPCTPRTHPTFTINEQFGKIYVGKGGSASGNLKDWWEYDIVSNTWTQKTDFPSTARHHPYHFSIGAYSYTGLGHDNNPQLATKDFFRFDPQNDTWQQMADAPGRRIAGQQFTYNNLGFVIDGDGINHQPTNPSIFYKYDPATNTWDTLTPHPGASLWAPGSFIIEGHLYLFGGVDFIQGGVFFGGMWSVDLDALLLENKENEIANLQVYPNPFSDYLFIEGKQEIINSNYQIVDITGKTILEGKIDGKEIFLGNLQRGIYLIKFEKKSTPIKIIKE